MSIKYKLVWFIAMAVLTAMLYLAFKAYLSPALLLEFANIIHC